MAAYLGSNKVEIKNEVNGITYTLVLPTNKTSATDTTNNDSINNTMNTVDSE